MALLTDKLLRLNINMNKTVYRFQYQCPREIQYSIRLISAQISTSILSSYKTQIFLHLFLFMFISSMSWIVTLSFFFVFLFVVTTAVTLIYFPPSTWNGFTSIPYFMFQPTLNSSLRHFSRVNFNSAKVITSNVTLLNNITINGREIFFHKTCLKYIKLKMKSKIV